jgi:hypothetical protein
VKVAVKFSPTEPSPALPHCSSLLHSAPNAWGTGPPPPPRWTPPPPGPHTGGCYLGQFGSGQSSQCGSLLAQRSHFLPSVTGRDLGGCQPDGCCGVGVATGLLSRFGGWALQIPAACCCCLLGAELLLRLRCAAAGPAGSVQKHSWAQQCLNDMLLESRAGSKLG